MNKYSTQSITVQQGKRKQSTIRANIIKVSNHCNSGRNGAKEIFLHISVQADLMTYATQKNHKFNTPDATYCYDKPLGDSKWRAPKYLSKKSKSIFIKELSEAMHEENEGVDFLQVYSGTTSESV